MGTMSEVKISNTGRRLDSKSYDVSVSIDANNGDKTIPNAASQKLPATSFAAGAYKAFRLATKENQDFWAMKILCNSWRCLL
jgi:hypothetical protein